MTNKFEHLNLELTEASHAEAVPSTGPANTAQKEPVIHTAQLEPDISEEEDVFFKLFCFLEDLYTVRDFVRDLTVRQRDGQIDNLTLLVVVNAAMICVKQREMELLDGAPESWRPRLESPVEMLSLLNNVTRASQRLATAWCH
jgi:hypothetical protein